MLSFLEFLLIADMTDDSLERDKKKKNLNIFGWEKKPKKVRKEFDPVTDLARRITINGNQLEVVEGKYGWEILKLHANGKKYPIYTSKTERDVMRVLHSYCLEAEARRWFVWETK